MVVLLAMLATRARAEEVIEIHETWKAWQPPTPPRLVPTRDTDPRVAPPYSDEAKEKDVWVRAWVMLEIDERGRVRRMKFLRHPGYGLDDIARARVFAMTFTPALDEHGRPMAVNFVTAIEWPSWGWMATRTGVVTRIPPPDVLAHVPCRGSGPLHLDSIYPAYRDCSKPDLARADREPWIRARDHASPWIDAPLASWPTVIGP